MLTHAEKEQKTLKLFELYAQEKLTVELLGDTYYAFGSELACLRLFAKYNTNGASHNPKARVGYSQPKGSWYFSLDVVFEC